MLKSKKAIIGIALIGLFLMPLSAQFTAAANDEIGVSENSGAITVTTEYISIKILPSQAHLMWWFGNKSNSDEMYKLQLNKITEFMGDDDVLDSKTELGGISYNLISSEWDYTIVEEEDSITITLSLLGLANGADIYLIMHVYNDDEPIPGTDATVDGLTELKFDIVVDNWAFSPMAQGYAIQTYLTEVQHRHRVTVRNGTTAENGNLTRTMAFESDEYTGPVAYFEWTEFANIYNESDDLVDTVDVGTAYFDDLINPPTEAPGFAEGLAHLWLTYPKYTDGYKLIHDPTIGVNEEAFTEGLSLYLFPILGGLLLISATVLIIRKKRK